MNGVQGIVFLVAASALAQNVDFYDDDLESDFRADVRRTASFSATIATIDLLMTLLAIIGAFKYSIIMVAPSVVWGCLSFALATIVTIHSNNQLEEDFSYYESPNLVPGLISRAIAMALYIYPQVGFIHEVRSGTLSPETYVREEYSCCCGPKRN